MTSERRMWVNERRRRCWWALVAIVEGTVGDAADDGC